MNMHLFQPTSGSLSPLRRRSCLALFCVVAVAASACSGDSSDDAAAKTTTAVEATASPPTTEALVPPPEAGEPNTINIVFEDGETGAAPVFCDSDPDEQFYEFSVRSDPDGPTSFELLGFEQSKIKVATWKTEDETWFVEPGQGSIDLVEDPPSQSPISGTGVFVQADLTEDGEMDMSTGQALSTGEERAAAFTIVCADFGGGDLSPLTTSP
jgi:hypothetical protein